MQMLEGVDYVMFNRLCKSWSIKVQTLKEYPEGEPCIRCGRTKNHYNKDYCERCKTAIYFENQDKVADRDYGGRG